MKNSIAIFVFILLSSSVMFGQRNFYVNDTLQTEKNKLKVEEIYAYNSISRIFDSQEAYASVIGLVVEGNKITVDITYKGGCGDYFFKLYEKYELIDTVPTVSLLPLVVNTDKCTLIQLETIYFDISHIKEKYKLPVRLKIGRFETMIVN
ncbi:MAG: hypothetical protein PHR83_13545 [Paludibacter sp.]|nr:hypothetical protein [Paludibacter sp.]